MPMPRPSFDGVVQNGFLHLLRSWRRAGYTLMLSPEWTPVRSTCSMMPGMNTSVPSQTASTSTSLPMIYLSTSTGLLLVDLHGGFQIRAQRVLVGDDLHGAAAQHISWAAPAPDSRCARRRCTPSSMLVTAWPCGLRDVQRLHDLFKGVPVFGPLDGGHVGADDLHARARISGSARLMAVWPPREAITP